MSSRLRCRSFALLGTALLLAGASVPAASAADDPAEGGLWYLSVTGVTAAHERQTTGSGIDVAVIDGPINPTAPDLVGTSLITQPESFCDKPDGTPASAVGTTELSEHATNMVSLIIGSGVGVPGQPGVRGVAPGATVRHYAALDADKACSGVRREDAIDQAVADGADIISFSLVGYDGSETLSAIARAERAGVIFVAASNNRGGTNLGWPASANGVVSVEAAGPTGELGANAVTNPLLAIVAPGVDLLANTWSDGAWDTYMLGTGSSYATAWTSGVLALVWSAHPEATANQVIQTLLHNAGSNAGAPDPTRTDAWGYGTVSLNSMLAVDPTTYPDVNPLVRDTPDAAPSAAEIAGPATPAPDAETETAKPDDAAGGLPTGPLILGASLLGLLALAGSGVAIVLSRRRSGPSHLPHDAEIGAK